MKTYNVTVKYGGFINQYDRVDTQQPVTPYGTPTSGTKSMSVSVIQFNDLSAGLTTAQTATRLLSLGYRPATLDEALAIQSGNTTDDVDAVTVLGYKYTGFFTALISNKCPGKLCAGNVNNMIYNGDKVAAVKL